MCILLSRFWDGLVFNARVHMMLSNHVTVQELPVDGYHGVHGVLCEDPATCTVPS